jgi:alanine racemase
MATEPSRAVLTIDLCAIVENHRRLRREARGSEVAAVVKADGYGLGAQKVAAALWQDGVRCFFVAHPDEGLALRRHLPRATIFVLHGLQQGSVEAVADTALVPVLNSPGELARYAALARRRERRLPTALQIDTGMCRLGFSPAELRRVAMADLDALDLRLVMSHLACAEDPANPLNEAQRTRFEQLCALLPEAPASLANSSGIFLGPAFHYALCRPGVALYGVNPTPTGANPMAAVVTLEAPVLQVHDVAEPGSVGYGATYPTAPGRRIATVPLGYADGYLRSASGRATARIAGQEVPLAGRVSMDLISLDVSGLPAGAVRPGTMVELLGGPDGVDRLAEAAGTIGYEVLTRLGSRLARRYIRPAAEKTRR